MKSIFMGFIMSILGTGIITIVAICLYAFIFLIPTLTGYECVFLLLLVAFVTDILFMWCIGEDILRIKEDEVVRCKDCKFNVANMEKDPLDTTDYSGDDIVCSYFMTDGLNPNAYCSYGVRK